MAELVKVLFTGNLGAGAFFFSFFKVVGLVRDFIAISKFESVDEFENIIIPKPTMFCAPVIFIFSAQQRQILTQSTIIH